MADEKLSDLTSVRLNTLVETTDGFKISEVDMKLRGPGEFFGIRQSGELKFSAADLVKDKQIVEKARETAFKLVGDDPQLRKKENESIKENFLLNYRESMSLIKVA
jgi:ATP-dependent DNA helicase RecG